MCGLIFLTIFACSKKKVDDSKMEKSAREVEELVLQLEQASTYEEQIAAIELLRASGSYAVYFYNKNEDQLNIDSSLNHDVITKAKIVLNSGKIVWLTIDDPRISQALLFE